MTKIAHPFDTRTLCLFASSFSLVLCTLLYGLCIACTPCATLRYLHCNWASSSAARPNAVRVSHHKQAGSVLRHFAPSLIRAYSVPTLCLLRAYSMPTPCPMLQFSLYSEEKCHLRESPREMSLCDGTTLHTRGTAPACAVWNGRGPSVAPPYLRSLLGPSAV